jgi:hypothetical protein
MEPNKQIPPRFSIPLSLSRIDWFAWLPSRGNVVFTLVVMIAMFWAQSANALPWMSQTAAPGTSTGTWPYQGRLATSAGAPITNTVPMIFRLYDADSGTTPLWEEQWTGPNSVQVSDGLFNVMLGSLIPIPQSVISGNGSLWLGITAGTDDEMAPRVQLGSVPFAVQALTVPDGSITTKKFAPGALSSGVPVGTVISWWRASADAPLPSGEWAIADGSTVTDTDSPLNGKTLPNLTNRFVMGVAAADIGVAGGANSLDLSHSHILPAHTHTVVGETGEVAGFWDGGYYTAAGDGRRFADLVYGGDNKAWYYRHNHSLNLTSSSWSGNTNSVALTIDNRPAYVGLIYIIKIK